MAYVAGRERLLQIAGVGIEALAGDEHQQTAYAVLLELAVVVEHRLHVESGVQCFGAFVVAEVFRSIIVQLGNRLARII